MKSYRTQLPTRCRHIQCPFFPTSLSLSARNIYLVSLFDERIKLHFFRSGMPELKTWDPILNVLLTPLWGIVGTYVGIVDDYSYEQMFWFSKRRMVSGTHALETKVKPFIREQAPNTLLQLARIESNPAVLLSVMAEQKILLSPGAAQSLAQVVEKRFENSYVDLYLWECVIFCRVWCRDEVHMPGQRCSSLHQELREPYTLCSPDQ